MLKSDGSVFSCGPTGYGSPDANQAYSAVSSQLASGVSSLYSHSYSFSALKTDGSVVAWGRDGHGNGVGTADVSSGVVAIHTAFLMHDGGAMHAVKSASRWCFFFSFFFPPNYVLCVHSL